MLGALAVYQTSAGEPSPEQTQLLRRLVALGRLAIEQEHARERLVYLSSHDELTGLLNRGSFFTRCAEVLRDVDAGHTTAAVVFVDVDGFKPLNDRYGHGVGDQLLRVTARRLQSAVRPHDVVSRFGGDEFVLLCQGLAEEAQVVMLAERVLAELGAPIIAAGAKLKVTVSAGAAIAYAGTVRGVEELLSSADAAMYQAKRLGGNQVVVANEPLE
jgi:diguanylate cyclase (GGDEF)-like protein